MISRLSTFAAVLSGVTASLTIPAVAAAAQQQQPVVVRAQPIDENLRTEHVSYADLDLVSAKGAKTLHYRVARAVRNVCLFDRGTIGLQSGDYYNCADGAWDRARPQIASAVDRAREIAMTGKSSIAAGSIVIDVGG